MSTRTKAYGFLVLLLLLGGGYYANQKWHMLGGKASAAAPSKDAKSDPAKKQDKDSTAVEVATVVKGPISSYISSTGNLRALRTVVVASLADGIVKAVQAEEGDHVQEGQVICLLDDTELKIRQELTKQKLAQARSQSEKAAIRQQKASVQINNSRTEYERYKLAFDQGVASAQDLAQRKYQLDELEHDQRVAVSESGEFSHHVSELEAELAQVELELSRTRIRAPFSGYITARTVELGQRVRNLDPLFQLGAFSPLYADIYLSEREAQQVRAGQPGVVRLGSDGTEEVTAAVERISPVVDQSTGTVKITMTLQGTKTGFRPGAFVRVDLRTDTRAEAILVPKRAVMEQDGENYVFVAHGQTARRTKVTTGYESEGRIEIRQGLSPGEKVVVAGQGALREGSKIKVSQG